MLAAHLGKDVFLNGVAAYLKAHAYGQLSNQYFTATSGLTIIGNATTNDLWAALKDASGKDIKSFMVLLIKTGL